MVSPVPSRGRPKAMEQTKNFNVSNDRKDSPCIRDLTHSQLTEIFQHLSVDKLRTRCISREASDRLKFVVLTSPQDTPAIRKRF